MDPMNQQQAERDDQRAQANREELGERITQAVPTDGTVQPLPGLHLSRASIPRERMPSVVDPSLCVIAQGSKEVLMGKSRYLYDPYHYLLTTVQLPRIHIIDVEDFHPFDFL